MAAPAAPVPAAALGGPRAYAVWIAAVTAYSIAVLQRTTMGVAGLEAADRFGASATIVSTFVVLQLGVYALAQIPAGVLLDRYGSRVTLTAGAVLMALGQVLMSQTETVGVAMIARIVLGAGDALTFASAIRLVPAWFPPGRVPLLTQLTGILGQVGQILSAVPFVAVLSVAGWTPAFSSAAALSGIAAVLVLLSVLLTMLGGLIPARKAAKNDPVAALRTE